MSNVIFIPKFSPSPDGHGGHHRSYQIDHDLRTNIGAGHVTTLSYQEWETKYLEARSSSARFFHSLTRSIRKRVENPFKLFSKANFVLFDAMPRAFLDDYLPLVRKVKPDLTIVEDAGLYKLIEVNRLNHIRTICAPQNLESLDTIRQNPQGPDFGPTAAMDLRNEIQTLARYDQRLMISKTEAGFLGGIGLPSQHYPYLPVGEIRRAFIDVRERREAGKIDQNLFLMLGTADHPTTRDAFEWFLTNAAAHSLPKGVKVVLAGLGTQHLLPAGGSIPGIQSRGWLEPEELNSLLAKARAVLVPQLRGFGTLTRLSEFSCAGIPTLVSMHPTYAVGRPPGSIGLSDQWDEWRLMMGRMQSTAGSFPFSDYQEWEQTQSVSIDRLLRIE